MPLLNKEKMMDGFGKAVDAVNNAADKAGKYAKEKELDKKIVSYLSVTHYELIL